MRHRHHLLLIPCLLLAAPAAANDASFMGDGATVFAIKEERITMERESIVIRHDPAAKLERRWVADCTFTFRNLTPRQVEVQVGFPDWKAQGEVRGWAIRDFVATVEGKEVKATHKKIEPPGPLRPQPLPRQVKLAYQAAYTWPVVFPPNGRVVIRNRYRFGGHSSNGPLAACLPARRAAEQPDLFWRLRLKGGVDFADAFCSSASYIVTSGRTWAGRIGEAEIAIQLPADAWPHLFTPLPPASSVDGGWVRWRFKDWAPSQELMVVLFTPTYAGRDESREQTPFFESLDQAKAWTRFAVRNGLSATTVRLLRDAYRARHGSIDGAAKAAVNRFYAAKRASGPSPKATQALDLKVMELLDQTAKQLESKRGPKR
jgi:hypothetical protein